MYSGWPLPVLGHTLSHEAVSPRGASLSAKHVERGTRGGVGPGQPSTSAVEVLVDDLHEGGQIEGLVQNNIGARMAGQVAPGPTDQNNRDSPGLLVRLELTGELRAVHARHHDVRDDQIRSRLSNEGQSVHAVFGFNGRVAGVSQEQRQQDPNRLGVIDDQNQGYGGLSRSWRFGRSPNGPARYRTTTAPRPPSDYGVVTAASP
jgi:hypothetical protein